jgi:hypothetical protein
MNHFCTIDSFRILLHNNQAEYEGVLFGMQILSSMGVKSVEAFSDSLLVVQQIAGVFHCFDGLLNAYLDKCVEIIALFDDFSMQHVSRDENTLVNDSAQQASGFRSNQGNFGFLEKTDDLVCQTGQSGFWPMHSMTVCSAEPSSAKLDVSVSETGGSRISRTSKEASKMTTFNHDDWRTPLVHYLENPSHVADRKIRRQDLKYVMLDNTLYH